MLAGAPHQTDVTRMADRINNVDHLEQLSPTVLWHFVNVFCPMWHVHKATLEPGGRGNCRGVRQPNLCQSDAIHHAWMTSSYRTSSYRLWSAPPASAWSHHHHHHHQHMKSTKKWRSSYSVTTGTLSFEITNIKKISLSKVMKINICISSSSFNDDSIRITVVSALSGHNGLSVTCLVAACEVQRSNPIVVIV